MLYNSNFTTIKKHSVSTWLSYDNPRVCVWYRECRLICALYWHYFLLIFVFFVGNRSGRRRRAFVLFLWFIRRRNKGRFFLRSLPSATSSSLKLLISALSALKSACSCCISSRINCNGSRCFCDSGKGVGGGVNFFLTQRGVVRHTSATLIKFLLIGFR